MNGAHVVIAIHPRGRTVTSCDSLSMALTVVALSNMRGDAKVSVLHPNGELQVLLARTELANYIGMAA